MAITITKSTYVDNRIVNEEIHAGVGTTLKVWNDYIQVMSDVWEITTYATYWDDEAGCLRTETWVKNGVVDATTEVLEKVKVFLFERAFEEAKAKAENEAAVITKGSIVKVASGRFGKGTVGKVVVEIQRPYQTGYRSSLRSKVGIATSEEKVKVAAANGKVYENYKDVVWAWAHNCELVTVPEIDLQAVKERAEAVSESKFKNLYKAA